MTEVTLIEVLISREKRAEKQKNILQKFGYPIISFTMNIAGPVKTSPLIERAFFEGIRLLDDALSDKDIAYRDTDIKVTGCEAIFSVNADASDIKKICTRIEEKPAYRSCKLWVCLFVPVFCEVRKDLQSLYESK